MKVGESVGWGLLALLLLAAVALTFSIDFYLGTFVLFLTVAALVWAIGIKKRKVDKVLANVAAATGLERHRHPFTYGRLSGQYKGFEVEVRVATDREASHGFILTGATGLNLAPMDIRNFTLIRACHRSKLSEDRVISSGWPRVVARSSEISLALPHVSEDAKEIKQCLSNLVSRAKALEQER